MTDDATKRLAGLGSPEKELDVQEEETQAFLDALTLRSKSELDVNLAKSMQTVLGQAIRMVEAGTADADKATPGGASSLPHYTNLVFDSKLQDQYLHGHTFDVPGMEYVVVRQGIAFGHADQSYVDTMSSHKPVSGKSAAGSDAQEREFSPVRVFLAGGIPVGTTAVGLLLMAGSLIDSPVKPNPYVALSILIAGVGLIATAVVALRERRQDL